MSVKTLNVVLAGVVGLTAIPGTARTFNNFDGVSGQFGNLQVSAKRRFNDVYPVVLPSDGELSASIVAKAPKPQGKTVFTRVRLIGPDGLVLYFTPLDAYEEDRRVFVTQKLGAGTYVLEVQGVSGVTASYEGTLNFQQFGSFPEPVIWLMLLFGFGSLGYVARRGGPSTRRIRFH